MRTVLLAVAALGLLQGTRAFGAQSYYCEKRTTRWFDGKQQSGTIKIWVNPPAQARLEISNQGGSSVTVLNGADAWMFSPARKAGVHRRGTPADVKRMQSGLKQPSADVLSFIKQGGKKVGQETIGGVRCDKYRQVSNTSGMHVTSYLWVIPGKDMLSRRQESVGTMRVSTALGQPMTDHKIRSVTEFMNWKLGAPMPPSLFRPQAGIKFEEAPARAALPSGHPGVPTIPPGHPSVGGKPRR